MGLTADGIEKDAPAQVSSHSLLWDILFFWMSPTMFLGKRRPLLETDLPVMPQDYGVQALLSRPRLGDLATEQTVSNMSKAAEKRNLWQLVRAERLTFGMAGVAALIYITCQISSPLLLLEILKVAEDGDYDKMPRFIAAYATTQLGAGLSNQMQMHLSGLVGQRLRAQLIGLVFRKALRLAPAQRLSNGHIVNLMSNDTQKVLEALQVVHKLWASPLQIFICSIFLVAVAGPTALLGIAMLFALVPSSNYLARVMERVRKQHLAVADQRLRLCIEMLTGVRCIKYFAWERPYLARIFEKRTEELQWVLRELHIYGYSMVCTVMGPAVSFAVVLVTGILLDPTVGVGAERTFGILFLMTGLRFPIMDLGSLLATVVALVASWERLGSFLSRDEALPDIKTFTGDPEVVRLRRCAIGYATQEGNALIPTVGGIDLSVRIGELVVIEGRVGSGKSTLLQSVIGELQVLEGEMSVTGPIAYCAQHPWVLNASVRDNILFGSDFDAVWYEEVVRACCLEADFLQWPQGDDTEVGERGVTLSGGQKQRVALARAVYLRSCKLVLLDDVFSALDAHTGQHVLHALFKMPGGLLRDRGVLLAAHGANCAEYAQQVLSLSTGSGTSTTSTCSLRQGEALAARQVLEEEKTAKPRMSLVSQATFEGKEAAKPLMSKEEREEGGLSWQSIRAYISGVGGLPIISVGIFSMTLERAFVCGDTWWLSKWSTEDPHAERPEFYLTVYVLLIFCCLMFVATNRMAIGYMSRNAAGSLFEQMALQVMRAPCSWWDTTPQGRVINRFSFDTDMIDTTLLFKLFPAIMSLSWMSGSIVVINAVLWPYATIALPLPAFVYLWLFQFARKSIRELQRIDSITRSPMQSVFAEALHGLASVRAYQVEARYSEILANHIDLNGRSVIAFNAASRWLGIRLETLATVCTLASATGCYLNMENMTPGLLGLCLAWSINLTISLNYNCQFWSQAEAAFTSVERVVKYAKTVPTEGARPDLDSLGKRERSYRAIGKGAVQQPLEAQTCKAAAGASMPMLRFEGVCLSYREDLPLALNGISFDLQEGERMGVVGRTGSGKSTLAVALFRLTPLSSGHILLGGTDMMDFSLDIARKSLGIITQDPVIFSGTVKYNLDPFDEFSRDACAAALEHSQLADSLSLDTPLEEAGANRSVGERQLLCLARALLRKPRLLVCDEATSSVDYQTDELVQSCLRGVNSALLTIAHRLETIADYDRVLVLESGKVLENGHPHELLSKADGAFVKLVDRLAPTQASSIREIASKAKKAERLTARAHAEGFRSDSAHCVMPPLLRLMGLRKEG